LVDAVHGVVDLVADGQQPCGPTGVQRVAGEPVAGDEGELGGGPAAAELAAPMGQHHCMLLASLQGLLEPVAWKASTT